MQMRLGGRAALALWLCLLCFAMLPRIGVAQALQPIPPLEARVTDLTGSLSTGERDALEQRLAAFEQTKGSQIALLIVPTTQPEAIEQYSIRVVDAWQLGRKDVDDGVLLLVAKNDRKLRIEVGRGLEGVLPDAIAKRIIAERISPAFREGRFADGLSDGVDAILARIQGEPLPPPRQVDVNTNDVFDLLVQTLFVAAIAAPILRSVFGRLVGAGVGAVAGGGWWLLSTSVLALGGLGAVIAALVVIFFGSGRGGGPWTTGSGHGGGFGSSGGGWSSGGGGGFSGGGGGFSGGGASGGW
ncbi:YgcG family protein [Zoogloeaceae bacterium G21618-S1]|nr:YgcG family protein [Zoogloeaceae bacterium G21618-S1]